MRVVTKQLRLESHCFCYKVALHLIYLHIKFDDEIDRGSLVGWGGFRLCGTISWRWCEIELRSQLITNRKSCIAFNWNISQWPWVTLNMRVQWSAIVSCSNFLFSLAVALDHCQYSAELIHGVMACVMGGCSWQFICGWLPISVLIGLIVEQLCVITANPNCQRSRASYDYYLWCESGMWQCLRLTRRQQSLHFQILST